MQIHLLIVYALVFSALNGNCQSDSIQRGVASYYADKFEGKKTASGEVFSNLTLSAAHKSLPFGTLVKVTNLKNDSTVILFINDRLPSSSTRVIDLSKKAAEKLNFVRAGLTPVSIEIIDRNLVQAK